MVNQGCEAKSLDSYNPLISAAIWVDPLFRELFNFPFYWIRLMVSDDNL